MDRLEVALTDVAPPRLGEAARQARCLPEGVRALERAGRIVVLEPDLAYAMSTYRDLAATALRLAATGPLTPAAFRDATGTSRKYVMAILEDLDRRAILRRTPAGHVPGPKAPTAATGSANRRRPAGDRRRAWRARKARGAGCDRPGRGALRRFGRDKLAATIDGTADARPGRSLPSGRSRTRSWSCSRLRIRGHSPAAWRARTTGQPSRARWPASPLGLAALPSHVERAIVVGGDMPRASARTCPRCCSTRLDDDPRRRRRAAPRRRAAAAPAVCRPAASAQSAAERLLAAGSGGCVVSSTLRVVVIDGPDVAPPRSVRRHPARRRYPGGPGSAALSGAGPDTRRPPPEDGGRFARGGRSGRAERRRAQPR